MRMKMEIDLIECFKFLEHYFCLRPKGKQTYELLVIWREEFHLAFNICIK